MNRQSPVPGRAAGVGGLVFAILLVIQNVVRASEPSFDASPAELSAYFADNRVAALTPLALFPLGMVALLLFGAGVCTAAREHPTGRFFAGLGGLAVAILAGLFAVVNVIEITIAVDATDLAGAPHVLAALWAAHAAAFGLNLTAIAIALIGLSRAARSIGAVPRWIAVVAPAGAVCLFAASVATVALAEGSPVLYLGFAGFLTWGVFLIVAGSRLAFGQARTVARPDGSTHALGASAHG